MNNLEFKHNDINSDDAKYEPIWKIIPDAINYIIISPIKNMLRRIKIKRYKKRSIMIEKQSGDKMYDIHFKIKVNDENAQISTSVYQMEVPAQAAFIAKDKLLQSVRKKIDVEVIKIDSIEK